MAIKKKVYVAAGGNTHSGNNTDVKVEKGDAKLDNNQDSMLLTAPEDVAGGSTHSDAPVKVKASADMDESVDTSDDSADFADPEDDLPEDGDEVDAEFDDEDVTDDADVDTSFDTQDDSAEDFNDAATDEPDWDTSPADAPVGVTEDDEPVQADVEDLDADGDDDMELPEGDMSLLDVDGTDDSDLSNVAFASFGTHLHVIKANRIIASMSKRIAANTNRQDIYLTDQFQEVVASEMNKAGLRTGLKSMGFVLAKVDISSQDVVNARVKQEVTKTTAAVRKVTASKEAAFQQSLAIAAVGINRNFFKDVPNELKATLEAELSAAGVRNPGRILARAFAQSGPNYAKALVTLATKISAMPEESRNGYVDALDMTSEDPDSEFPDEENEVHGEEGEDMDFADDMEVSASLSSPGTAIRNTKVSASVSNGMSVTASQILNGSKPLF